MISVWLVVLWLLSSDARAEFELTDHCLSDMLVSLKFQRKIEFWPQRNSAIRLKSVNRNLCIISIGWHIKMFLLYLQFEQTWKRNPITHEAVMKDKFVCNQKGVGKIKHLKLSSTKQLQAEFKKLFSDSWFFIFNLWTKRKGI